VQVVHVAGLRCDPVRQAKLGDLLGEPGDKRPVVVDGDDPGLGGPREVDGLRAGTAADVEDALTARQTRQQAQGPLCAPSVTRPLPGNGFVDLVEIAPTLARLWERAWSVASAMELWQ
jgi:hypothetical protein